MLAKADSPPELVRDVIALEARADRCLENLDIYGSPRGLAAWGMQTFLVDQLESSRRERGDVGLDAALLTLSHVGALAISHLLHRCPAVPCSLDDYFWTAGMAAATHQAWRVFANYSPFLDAFPMWHRNRMLLEVQPDGRLRFAPPGGAAERRVSAFHKGIRPPTWATPPVGLELPRQDLAALDALVDRCFYAGVRRLAYPTPTELCRQLLPIHLDRVSGIVRRSDDIDLGGYAVRDVRYVYAALTALCAIHDYACFRFTERYEIPINSYALMKPTAEWTALLSDVSGVEAGRTAAVLSDLTMRDRRWDLHVQPFAQVDDGHLSLPPQFPLNSRPDENLLRVCGHLRREVFDAAALLKQEEMLTALAAACPPRYGLRAPVPLPRPLPDVDLLLSDEEADAVIVAELKWLRKPLGWPERLDRSSDFAKGLGQVSDARRFLQEHPRYLLECGRLPRPLNAYAHLYYVLVARDHLEWSDEIPVVDYALLVEALRRAVPLHVLMGELLSYDWLPVEGRDFEVRFEPAVANGVTIETPVYFRV